MIYHNGKIIVRKMRSPLTVYASMIIHEQIGWRRSSATAVQADDQLLRRSLMNKLIGLIHTCSVKEGLNHFRVCTVVNALPRWPHGICAYALTRSCYCNITRLSAVVVGFVISVWPRASVRLPLRVRLDLIFQ